MCTLSLLLGFVAELQGEVGAFTETVAGQWEEGLQQGQTGLKVCPEGVLGHPRQPGGEPRGGWERGRKRRGWRDGRRERDERKGEGRGMRWRERGYHRVERGRRERTGRERREQG